MSSTSAYRCTPELPWSSIAVERSLEIKGIGCWPVVVQLLQPLEGLGPIGHIIIRYPPSDVGGPVWYQAPSFARAKRDTVRAVICKRVDRLQVHPQGQGVY
jgi:hypothetical protein